MREEKTKGVGSRRAHSSRTHLIMMYVRSVSNRPARTTTAPRARARRTLFVVVIVGVNALARADMEADIVFCRCASASACVRRWVDVH